MNQQRIEYLLGQCENDRLTNDERKELLLWLSLPENEKAAGEWLYKLVAGNQGLMAPSNEESSNMLESIFFADAPVKKVVPLRSKIYRIAAAAVLAGFLFSAWWLWLKPLNGEKTNDRAMADVAAPASTKATIRLANGTLVHIDSAGSGQLALQGKIKLVKLADGSIAYEAEDGSMLREMQYNTLVNPRGSRVVSMALSDGSHVWLNAGSSLTYPVAFTGAERKVVLEGEGYFEVAKDPTKKFMVEAGGLITEVLGTHFNINAYPGESGVYATLLEGSVRVSNEGGSVLITPGQQASQNGDNSASSAIKVEDANTEKVMAWKNGFFNFNDASLAQVMNQLTQWYDIDIKYPNGVPEIYFVGEISRNVPLSDILTFLQTTGVHFKMDGTTLSVIP